MAEGFKNIDIHFGNGQVLVAQRQAPPTSSDVTTPLVEVSPVDTSPASLQAGPNFIEQNAEPIAIGAGLAFGLILVFGARALVNRAFKPAFKELTHGPKNKKSK